MRSVRDITSLSLGTVCRLSRILKNVQDADQNISSFGPKYGLGFQAVLKY